MIRVFEIFRKLNLNKKSAKDLFFQAMADFKPHKHKCPCCKTKYPGWKRHGIYSRYLISFEDGSIVTNRISITRYRCSSCGHTHAVLPECIIPYQSYSLLFIIAVMKDYYNKTLTVEGICSKYDISVSSLYLWKKLLLRHKKLWQGLLEDSNSTTIQFLDSLSTEGLLNSLKEFFLTTGISFLQGASHIRTANTAPS